MILLGDSGKGVSGTYGVVFHGCGLCGGAGGSFLLGPFLRKDAVFFVGAEDLVLIVNALNVALVGLKYQERTLRSL